MTGLHWNAELFTPLRKKMPTVSSFGLKSLELWIKSVGIVYMIVSVRATYRDVHAINWP